VKTTFDVLTWLYTILNVASVTTTIDGEVWKSKPPADRVCRDIVINSLPISWGPDVQDGIINVNCYCKDLDNGVRDESNLKAMTDAAIARLLAYSNTTGVYFHFEIENQAVYNDHDRPGMSYSNIRVKFYYET